MNAVEALDCLDFYCDCTFDEQVDPIAAVDALSTVQQRERLLAFDIQAVIVQLEHQTCLIRGPQHARTEFAVNSKGGANDHIR